MNNEVLEEVGESVEPTMGERRDVPSSSNRGEIARLTEHLFRHETGKLVSILTGIFGIERLQLAEDVVQESLIRAFQTWPYYGIPQNPAAWLTQTAKNLTLDLIRREKTFREKQEQIIPVIEQWSAGPGQSDGEGQDNEIKDDTLRLMFACCHPLVPQDAQAALALKTLCGFSPLEIAKAFLTTEAAIAKRLVRARQKIREQRIPFEIPAGTELASRLDGVLQTIYLLFNEGYKASSGDSLIREDLCDEAIRMAELLVEHPAGRQPQTNALLSLMFLNAARLPARLGSDGNILRLSEQNRASWNQQFIAKGMAHLAASAQGEQVTPYHLQAAIAARHCAAPDASATDWPRILGLYDQLIRMDGSPVVALNRAVAAGHVEGPESAIRTLRELEKSGQMENYYLLYAVMADFEMELNRFEDAADHLRKAVGLTELKSEKELLTKRLQKCEGATGKTQKLMAKG